MEIYVHFRPETPNYGTPSKTFDDDPKLHNDMTLSNANNTLYSMVSHTPCCCGHRLGQLMCTFENKMSGSIVPQASRLMASVTRLVSADE